MRIVYVTADRGIPVFGAKGASIHIQEMMRAFAKLGHDVRAVTARRGSEDPTDLIVEEVAQAAQGTERADKERAAMVQGEAIESRLLTLYQDWPFDLIYERYSLWSAAGCRAAKKLGVPVVTEVNAPLVEEQQAFRSLVCRTDARAIENEILSTSSALVGVSQQMATYLKDAGADAERVFVIGNAVDTEHFQPMVEVTHLPSVPREAFVVGFTGSLKKWHGVDTLLEAFRCFYAIEPSAHLLICGDGPKRGWIEGFIEGAGLVDAVTLTGWVAHKMLPGLIARMDIATAPYPEADEHYFSPLKLFEYLAMGRPIVASDIGQTAELLSGSRAAVLLPPGNAKALTTAMQQLKQDPLRRCQMSAAARSEGVRHDWIRNARLAIQIAANRSVPA